MKDPRAKAVRKELTKMDGDWHSKKELRQWAKRILKAADKATGSDGHPIAVQPDGSVVFGHDAPGSGNGYGHVAIVSAVRNSGKKANGAFAPALHAQYPDGPILSALIGNGLVDANSLLTPEATRRIRERRIREAGKR